MADLIDDVLKRVAGAVLDHVLGPEAPASTPASDPPPPGVIDAQVVEVRPGSIGEGLVDCRRRVELISQLLYHGGERRTWDEAQREAEWVVRFLYNNVLHPDAPAGLGQEIRAVKRRAARARGRGRGRR